MASFKVSKFQEFQEFQWLSEFQNFDGVSKFQEFQSFKPCLEIIGKFQSFEVSRVAGVSMALGVSKFGWSFKISGVSEFQGMSGNFG